MTDYGYLHAARVLDQDPDSGGWYLESVALARTSRWGPVPSCVPGLEPGDRVVAGGLGTTRDNLVILARVGEGFPAIADIPGLVAALAAKATVAALDALTTSTNAALATKVALTDPRLTDSRTPTAHAASHATAGSDPVTPASIGAVATTALGAASGVAQLDATQLLRADQTRPGTVCTSTTRPASPRVGDGAYETDTFASIICVAVGPVAWRYVTTPTVATATARDALPSKYVGLAVWRSDLNWRETYDGSAWRGPNGGWVVAQSGRTVDSTANASVRVLDKVSATCYAGRSYELVWKVNHASSAIGPPNGTIGLYVSQVGVGVGTLDGALATSPAPTLLFTSGLLINPNTYQRLEDSNKPWTPAATGVYEFGATATSNSSTITVTLAGAAAGTSRVLMVRDVTNAVS